MSLLTKFFPKKKSIEIEFCQKNLDRFLEESLIKQFQEILNTPKVQYKEFECLSHCNLCKKKPYAIVNGDIVSCDRIEDLISQIAQMKMDNNQ